MRLNLLARVLALFFFCTVSAVSARSPVPVELRVVGDVLPKSAVLITTGCSPESEKRVVLEQGVGRIVVELPEAENCNVKARAAGFWNPGRTIKASVEGVTVLHLWPAATLSCEVSAPRGGRIPAELRLRLRASSAGTTGVPDQPETVTITCPLADGHVEHCVVPAGTWHVRLHAGEYAPALEWGVAMPRGQRTSLGRIELRRGAVLFGGVVSAEGPVHPERVEVVARPVVDRRGPVSEEDERALKQLEMKTSLNKWGYFEFQGLSPGPWEIVARREGFVPASRTTVVTSATDIVDLEEPLVLEAARHLRVKMLPPVDSHEQPWYILVLSDSRAHRWEEEASGRTAEGTWTSKPLPAGPYLLVVQNSQEDVLARHRVELRRDEQQVEIQMDVVRVRGEVLLGEENIPATVWFGGKTGEVSVEARSDHDGELHAVLPRDGRWLVDVIGHHSQVQAEGVAVDVEPPEGSREAEVEIRLPDTRLEGNVVHEDGRGAPDASVEAFPSDARPPLQARTNADGWFAVRGLAPGVYRVAAEADDLRSRPVTAKVPEKGAPPPVQLVLEDFWKLCLRVVSGRTGVPKARVFAMSRDVSGVLLSSEESWTEIDGTLCMSLPQAAESVDLVVLAQGYVLKHSRVTRPEAEEEQVLLPLEGEGGTLTLQSLPPMPPTDGRERRWLVGIDGFWYPDHLITYWAHLNGESLDTESGSLIVRAMPAGLCSLCTLGRKSSVAVLQGTAVPRSSACVMGGLNAGGRLELVARSE